MFVFSCLFHVVPLLKKKTRSFHEASGLLGLSAWLPAAAPRGPRQLREPRRLAVGGGLGWGWKLDGFGFVLFGFRGFIFVCLLVLYLFFAFRGFQCFCWF